MYSAKIKSLYEEYGELIEFCRSNGQVSFELYINDTYKKALLLSAASYFETVITKTIHDFVNRKTKCNVEIVSFVDNKAMKRQYHTFFNWDGSNANQFFGLFGDAFKRKAREEIHTKKLDEAEVAFLTIGRERNRLVHQNYIEVQINDTFEEIFAKYEKACDFVDLITQLHMPPQKCSLTADDGASPPPEWCTASAEMVHGGR